MRGEGAAMPADDLNPNPIVAMAMRIRARRDLDAAIDSAVPAAPAQEAGADAAGALDAFAGALALAVKRLGAILGPGGVTFVRLERPTRLRLRFRDLRVALDLDAPRQLVRVRGLGLDGEYQFDASAGSQALINLSKLSTEEGYGTPLTPTLLLQTIARDAELPRPAHLDEPGPLRF